MKTRRPVESLTFDGMAQAVDAQAQAAAEYSGEQLTAKLTEPLASIDKAAARMELEAPLFYGTIHPTLF